MMGTHYVFLWQTSNNQVPKDTIDNTGSPVKLGAFYAWISHRLMLWTKMSEGKEKKQHMSKETLGPLEHLENCPKLQEAVCLKEQDIQNPDDSRLLHSYKPEIQPLNWTLHDVTERTYCSSDSEHRSKLYLLLKLSLRGAANQTKAVYHVSLHFWEWKEERHKDPV